LPIDVFPAAIRELERPTLITIINILEQSRWPGVERANPAKRGGSKKEKK
jgi:hypothetical protein